MHWVVQVNVTSPAIHRRGRQNARGDDPVSLALTCLVLAGEYVIDAETIQGCFTVLSVFADADWYACGCESLQDRHKRLHVAWELNHYGQIITWSGGAVCVCVCVCERVCLRMRRQVCLTWGRRRHINHFTVIQFTNNVNHFGMCLSGHSSLLLIILPFFSRTITQITA